MKKIITTSILIYATTVLFAQINLCTDNNMGINSLNECSQQDFVSVNGQNSEQNNLLLSAKNNKGTIWVMDSTYFYIYQTDWKLNICNKVISRNEKGDVTNAVNLTYNATTSTWTNRDTITAIYHNNKQQSYLKKPWNTTTNQWADTVEYMEYDDNGYMICKIERSWSYENNFFTSGSKKFYYTCDANGAILYYIYYVRSSDNTHWILSRKVEYSYDSNGNISKKIIQDWNSNSNDWVNYKRILYNCNSNGKITQEIIQSWNSSSNDWVNYQKNLYTYDNNNNFIKLVSQLWDTGSEEWKNGGQFLITYDDNNNQTVRLMQKWNASTGWVNKSQEIFTYDGDGNNTQVKSQKWDAASEQWINVGNTLYTYNNGNKTVIISQKWNAGQNAWVNKNQFLFTYDGNGNKTEYKYQKWSTTSDMWENKIRNLYYWSEFEIAGITDIAESSIMLFPNPATDIITISADGLNKNSEVQIFSLSGKILQTSRLSQNKLNISNLQPGIYFIKIDNKQKLLKFIKQ